MNKSLLTVVILAKDEAANLKMLLPTLTPWKVLIINDHSNDETVAVARQAKAKILHHHLNGDYAAQRNFALQNVKTEWTLFLDADERISPKLVQEINETLSGSPLVDGFFIQRRDIFLGKQMTYGETGHMKLVRLGRTKGGSWTRAVHEVWNIPLVGLLKAPILHYAHSSIAHLKHSVERYAGLEAAYRYQQKMPWSLAETVAFPTLKFLKTFIWQQGFKDGIPGFYMSLLMAYHSLLVRLRTWQLYYAPSGPLSFSQLLVSWSIVLVLGLLPLGQLGRGEFFGLPLYAFEAIMAFFLLLWLVDGVVSGRRFPFTPVWGAAMGVLGVWLGSLWVNRDFLGAAVWGASLYWWRYFLYACWGYMIYTLTIRRLWCFPWKQALWYVGIGLTGLGWLQYLISPDMRWLYAKGWDDHYFRLIGTLLDPSFMGLLIVLTFLLTLERFGFKKPLWLLYFGGALVLTYSRTAYGLLILAVFLFLTHTKQFKQLMVLVSLFVLLVWLMPKPAGEGGNLLRTYSVTSRAESSITAWEWFRKRPLWGMGFNAYRSVAGLDEHPQHLPVHPSGPDNSFMLILATTGLVGSFAFLVYLMCLWRTLKAWPVGSISFLLILLHSLTNNSWFLPWVMIWVYGLLAGAEQEHQG